MTPSQLEYSIPFVSYHWRTTLFSIHNRETPRITTFHEEVKRRSQQVTLPGRTLEVILNMATYIDDFEKDLEDPARQDLVINLGMGDKKPIQPFYKNSGALSGKLAHAYLRAIIIDRVLWALAIDVLEPLVRYINDDFPAEFAELDMKRFVQPMADVAVCEDHMVPYPETVLGDGFRCGIAAIRHEGLAKLHNVASQLYYSASLMVFLGSVGEMYCIRSAQLTMVTAWGHFRNFGE